MTGKVETLRWRSGHLEMIDQRILPQQLRYITYNSAASVAEGIRTMVVRGAPAIGCAAAYGIALEALKLSASDPDSFNSHLEMGFEVLAASRPTAINLFWALRRMRSCWHMHRMQEPAMIAGYLLQEAHEILAEDVRVCRAMGSLGATLLKDGDTVLTHCNAGALATAGHGTALGVIRSAVVAGKRIHVIANETRPFLQGARLTAWEMLQEKIPVTLICDNMCGHLMKQGRIDAVIVGADRVAANGDVANKIGTYMVAVLARRHGIPFYVAAPVSTIDPAVATGSDIPIEERDRGEVMGFGGRKWAPEGVNVCNPAFDITPA
ncbi:MAG: S-methyl-5-thioribose-1-phosphate isomerase, partial [Mariprofundaceae bacterium]|nr:S-methyl-5-thioribose-1-phosphate isomerase [Mariprofundaceae bacterium]